MTYVEFEVVGTPAAQGSKRHVGNGRMVETARGHAPWRAAVAAAARDVAPDQPLDGPLHLRVEFRFPMPKSRPAATKAAGIAPKTSAPDLDKLVRAVGDALTEGGLIADDARISSVFADKYEVVGWTGARIRVVVLP